MTGFAKPKPCEITFINRMGFAKLKPPETIKFETKNNRQDSTDAGLIKCRLCSMAVFFNSSHLFQASDSQVRPSVNQFRVKF
jgi:hypothetical protein